jgi:hypothetical protein
MSAVQGEMPEPPEGGLPADETDSCDRARSGPVLASTPARYRRMFHLVCSSQPPIMNTNQLGPDGGSARPPRDVAVEDRVEDGGLDVVALQTNADQIEKSIVTGLDHADGDNELQFVSTQALFNGPPFHGLHATSVNPDRWLIQPDVDVLANEYLTWYHHPKPISWSQEAGLLFKTPGIPTSRTAPVTTTTGPLQDATEAVPYTQRFTIAGRLLGMRVGTFWAWCERLGP